VRRSIFNSVRRPMREDLDIPADTWWRPHFRHEQFKETGG
jgi:hypothetical protein